MRIYSGFVLTIMIFARWIGLFVGLMLAIVLTLGIAWLKDDPSTCRWPTVAGRTHQVCGTRAQRQLQIDGFEREWCEDVGPRFCSQGAR